MTPFPMIQVMRFNTSPLEALSQRSVGNSQGRGRNSPCILCAGCIKSELFQGGALNSVEGFFESSRRKVPWCKSLDGYCHSSIYTYLSGSSCGSRLGGRQTGVSDAGFCSVVVGL